MVKYYIGLWLLASFIFFMGFMTAALVQASKSSERLEEASRAVKGNDPQENE